MVGSFDSSRDWLVKQIVPLAAKAGWRFQAIALPSNIFTKLSIKDLTLTANGVVVQQFGSIVDAEN